MIGVMVGSIVILADVFLRSMWFSGVSGRRSRYSSKGGGQAQIVMMLLAVIVAVLAPLAAYIIYFAASRRREYLADASATMLTRYPEGLASALEAISTDAKPLTSANRATAPMYIANPLKKQSVSGLTSTHPPIDKRIRILRSIGGSLSYDAYQQAWRGVEGKAAGALPSSALSSTASANVREPSVEPAAKPNPRQQMRQATDLLRKANQFLFMSCVCGLQLKLPPDFKQDHVKCPRCSRDVSIPVAQMAVMHQVADAVSKQQSSKSAATDQQLEIVRRGKTWSSFKCVCGGTVNLSPDFAASKATCGTCGRTINIRNS
jgi:heat shock protein HtpX